MNHEAFVRIMARLWRSIGAGRAWDACMVH